MAAFFFVKATAANKSAANSPVEPSAPAGPARIVLLPVHDEPDRGRKPVIGDELDAVVTIEQHLCERVHLANLSSLFWPGQVQS